MIGIINVGKNADPGMVPVGDDVYELRINRNMIVQFTHRRKDGLVQCLRLAAIAVEQEEIRRKKLREWLEKHTDSVPPQEATKECVTHHHACDCREKLIQELCELYLRDHKEVKAFIAGFGKREECKCEGCEKARVLAPRTV